MQTVALLLGPVAALFGVWMGGVMTSRGHRKAWEREEAHRDREVVRRACADYVAATRRLATYLKDMDTVVRTFADPADGNIIAAADDATYSMALEEASATLLLTVRTSESIDRARDLRRAVIEMAISRADNPGGRMPLQIHEAVREAEDGFVRASRAELAAPVLNRGLYRLG